MATTKTPANVQDWTAIAQNAVGESAVVDTSDAYEAILHVQAGLDTITAHTGTKFVIQISGATSGDEDWQNFTEFVELIGTAATDLIEDNPLTAGSTAITLTAHALTVLGKWLLIENGTLANSELIFESAQATNSITCLDGTTNAHAVNTAIFNIAFTKDILLPIGVYRARVLVDNTYDADGSTLNYKVRITEVTVV